MRKHVFVSYARVDITYVESLVSELKKQDIPVWNDTLIQYGDRFPRALFDGIQQAVGVILVMSQHSRSSKWVQWELEFAEKQYVKLFPLLLENEVFQELSEIHYEEVKDGRMPSKRWFEIIRQQTVFPQSPTSSDISEKEIEYLCSFLLSSKTKTPHTINIHDLYGIEKEQLIYAVSGRLTGIRHVTVANVDLNDSHQDVGAIPPIMRSMLGSIPMEFYDHPSYKTLILESADTSINSIETHMIHLFNEINKAGHKVIVLINNIEELALLVPLGSVVGARLQELFESLKSVFMVPGVVMVVFFRNYEVIEQILRLHLAAKDEVPAFVFVEDSRDFLLPKYFDSLFSKQELTLLARENPS